MIERDAPERSNAFSGELAQRPSSDTVSGRERESRREQDEREQSNRILTFESPKPLSGREATATQS
jgi:hypothetical protein